MSSEIPSIRSVRGSTGVIPASLLSKAKRSNPRIYGAAPKRTVNTETMQQNFIDAPRKYVILNSSPEAIWLDSQSYFVVVPPRDSIIPEGEAFNAFSYKDPTTGEYVPGSVVATDIFTRGEFGERELVFDVVKAIKDCLGQDLVSGPLAKRGLSVVPLDTTQESIEILMQEGVSRWQQHRVMVAKEAMRAEQEKLLKHQKLGLPAPPPSPDVEELAIFLQEFAAAQRQRIADILAAEPPAEPTESQPTPSPTAEAATEDKAAGVRAGVIASIASPGLEGLRRRPVAPGVGLSERDKLLETLRTDPVMRKQIVDAAIQMEKRAAVASSVISAGVDTEEVPEVPEVPAEEPVEVPAETPETPPDVPNERVDTDPETGEPILRRQGLPSQHRKDKDARKR